MKAKMKKVVMIEAGVRIGGRKVYIQSSGDTVLDLRNRSAVRVIFAVKEDPNSLGQVRHLVSPFGRYEVPRALELEPEPEPEPEPESDVDWTGQTVKYRHEVEDIMGPLDCAFSHYAERGLLGTNICTLLEAMIAAIAKLDARTCRKE